MDRRKRTIAGREVIAFLDDHRLSHTPDHYAFAYEYLSGTDKQLHSRVHTAIDGGVRLTEDQVVELSSTALARRVAPELDHIVLGVLDVVGDAINVTSELSRELVTTSAALLDDPGSSVGPLLATMLRRAENAEVSFAQAAARARQIRAELAAIQTAGQHDPLTGLTNRLGLEDQLGAATKPVCLALVDIDGLRRVNESHSSAVGDRLLKVVARALTDQCRNHSVSRWGGGTFALLIENMDLRSAGEMVATVCEAISSREMKVRDTDKPLGRISLSAGVVARRGQTVEQLIEAAQQHLKKAKQAGRDRVVVEKAVIPLQ